MQKIIKLDNFSIKLIRRNIKNTHLSVYPPDGNVVMTTPKSTRIEVARAYAISKLKWIRNQQLKFKKQAREQAFKFINRETHQLWGRNHLLKIRPSAIVSSKFIILTIKPNTNKVKRAKIMNDWKKNLLFNFVSKIIKKWEIKLNVNVAEFKIRKMKTMWGTCNKSKRKIQINTELIKKPKDLVEYIVLHEMAHLIETKHNDRFVKILDKHYPNWRDARKVLNELPIPY